MIRRNLSHFGVTLLIAANWLSFAHAQSSTPQQDPAQSASGSTSWVFPQFHARDGEHPHEFIGGLNCYVLDSRNYRLNGQVVNVYRSPVSSTSGFYTGGLRGVTFTIRATTLF
jgi:hypothetical protein